MNDVKLITVTEAAEKWGVSRSAVMRWVNQNRIQWSKVGHSILIPADEGRPEKAARGTLTTEQREAVWKGGPPSRKSRGGK